SERDVEAAGERLRRERGVPAEAMKDAARTREFVENREQIGKRVARMEHPRLLELLRQAEHLADDRLLFALRHLVVIGEVVVEPDLADRAHARMAGQFAQLAALGRADGLSRGMRMPADGRAEARNAL